MPRMITLIGERALHPVHTEHLRPLGNPVRATASASTIALPGHSQHVPKWTFRIEVVTWMTADTKCSDWAPSTLAFEAYGLQVASPARGEADGRKWKALGGGVVR